MIISQDEDDNQIVEFVSGVKKITSFALNYLTHELTHIVIPTSVTSIEDGLYLGVRIEYKGTINQWNSSGLAEAADSALYVRCTDGTLINGEIVN